MSCPHSMIIVPTNQEEEEEEQKPFARSQVQLDPVLDYDSDDEQKQFAPSKTIPKLNNNNNNNNKMQTKTFTTSRHKAAFEQVKWFRNHVPIVNLNLNHKQQQQQDSPLDPMKDTATETVARTTVKEVDESNWTTKLSQTTQQGTLISGSDGSTIATDHSEEQWQHEQEPGEWEQKLANQLRGTFDSSLPLQQQQQQHQDFGSLTSSSVGGGGNVNELVGKRKLENNNMPTTATTTRGKKQEAEQEETSEWYTNEFGELVINKVSLYFAGKYTCLVAGQQSEVLLDVLMDTKKPNSSPSNNNNNSKESQQQSGSDNESLDRYDQNGVQLNQSMGNIIVALYRGTLEPI